MIVKQGLKYIIKSKEGKTLGEFSSEADAKKRLRQIEYFKHISKNK